ncbi:cupin domain-containing protein [Endozoicomonas sp. 4G]|uniref:cupin domain-containing protein n=1 Tax=Endozoicomonas sp. 4G TaxID=2872754 RepID=UPI002078F75F|nr:cupin domain-containing protein [Endozoicomonas sp. 4G]
MTFQKTLNNSLVRYMELIPGTSAFIDARTPGSHLKDNFCIIGAGVAENSKQHVHIRETAGFNIGAAGQPPGIKNSLHSHNSAELFIIFKGEFRFYWGNEGQYDTVLSPGDVISIPTNLFRGFEVVGRDYGFMFSVLGGDDSGGGVVWHPEVLSQSEGHGLYLKSDGSLVDTLAGDPVPESSELMPKLTDEEMENFDQYSVEQMQPFVVAKSNYRPVVSSFNSLNENPDYQEYALTGSPLAQDDFQVKSEDKVSIFAYELNNRAGLPTHSRKEKQVLINYSGDTLVKVNNGLEQGQILMTPGDVFSIPEGTAISLENQRGESLVYSILSSDQPVKPELQSGKKDLKLG